MVEVAASLAGMARRPTETGYMTPTNPDRLIHVLSCGNCEYVTASRTLGSLIAEWAEHMKHTHPGTWHTPTGTTIPG